MITTEQHENYVLNKTTGKVFVMEIVDYVHKNHEKWSDQSSLWDFSEASLADDVTSYDLLKARMHKITSVLKGRAGQKTAYVVSDDIAYDTAMMAISVGETIEKEFDQAVFRDLKEAEAWLQKE
ncbi:MAG: hypothetical protein PF692_10815 [Kiritimatiellae bacterium]|jgi:hypothetical protein|nr:hypothetical protein [Kiritimatiellia bacterium]